MHVMHELRVHQEELRVQNEQLISAQHALEESRDRYADLQALGADVYGLSSQSTEYQREAVDRLRLPFPLLSDETLALAEALSLPTFTAGGMRLYKRLTMLIRAGRIDRVFYPVPSPAEHADEVLAALGQQNPAM